MGDRKRTGESSAGLSIGPEIQPHYPFPFVLPAGTPTRAWSDQGPDKPQAEDDWKIPIGPIDETEGKDDANPEPAHSGREVGLLQRLTRRG